MSIIIALLVFGIIVMFHEFGHFIVAKKSGITVNEFAIGMGPKVFGVKRGGTEYTLRVLPIGGACMMVRTRRLPVPALSIPNPCGSEWLSYSQVRSLTLSWLMSALS